MPGPLSGEPEEHEGVGLIMARCLDEGTDRHTAEEMAEALERRGIALGAGVTQLGLVLDLDMTARRLQQALELAVECLATATFPDAEVRRQVRHRLSDIAQEHADPGTRAALEFLRTYYDPADRAARPAGGTRSTVAALTPELVRAHHAAVVRPDGAVLVLAGDLDGVDVEAVVGCTLGSWASPVSPPPPPAPVGQDGRRAADAGRVVLVDRPGSVQTEVYVGAPGPSRRDSAGWGTWQSLALALGGSPHSRLDRVLREERGYTYGMRCAFRPRSATGTMVVSGSVRAEVTGQALEALLEVLDTPGSDLGSEELRDAGAYVARTAPGRYATADALAGELAALALDGLGVDFVAAAVEQARTLDPDRAREAWDRVRMQERTVVLVGDAQQVLPQLSRLAGPVSVVTRD